jgi:hypothetical protein
VKQSVNDQVSAFDEHDIRDTVWTQGLIWFQLSELHIDLL